MCETTHRHEDIALAMSPGAESRRRRSYWLRESTSDSSLKLAAERRHRGRTATAWCQSDSRVFFDEVDEWRRADASTSSTSLHEALRFPLLIWSNIRNSSGGDWKTRCVGVLTRSALQCSIELCPMNCVCSLHAYTGFFQAQSTYEESTSGQLRLRGCEATWIQVLRRADMW